MGPARLLLDEHVNRVLTRVLRERGLEVVHARDEFGERTRDEELLDWCATNGVPIVTNDAKDFEPLHEEQDHPGILLFHRQSLQDDDPVGLGRAIERVLNTYGREELSNRVVALDSWYDWLHE